MTENPDITLHTELIGAEAEQDIAKAVSKRHAIARKYILRLRRRYPDATPAELIGILERHYATSISTAGAMITAGIVAADIGIAMIPVAGPAAAGMKSAGQRAAKKAGTEVAKSAAKQAMKTAAKGVALGAAKTGAQKAASMIPAGDQQIQFELTAVFALALADIHGMSLDQDQAHTLVYGLTNERVSQKQIAAMAADVAASSPDAAVGLGQQIAENRGDWSHWATTLSTALPAGGARDLVQTIQTGQFDGVRASLSGRQQAAVDYGVGAVVGGVTRFVFGRDVVTAARTAFPPPPDTFPTHLAVPAKADDDDDEPNRALVALEEAAKSTGTWISGAAGSVSDGVASGAAAAGAGVAKATKVFRRVDLDGDGVPDEAQALTAAKNVGGAIAGAAGAVGGNMASMFKSKKRRNGEPQDEAAES